MKNRDELLSQLGYSKEYLKLLNEESDLKTSLIPKADNDGTHSIVDTKVTSFIIDKPDTPISNNFIYNEGK